MGGGEAANDANQLTINGGTIVVNADGDGLDSNGNASITGGSIVVNGPTDSANGALDVNGTFAISGGTLLAAGSSGMAVAPEATSTQGWVAATFGSAQQAGTVVHIVAADGTEITSFTATKSFSSMVYSAAGIVSGATYSVYTGESVAGGTLAGTFTAGTASTGGMMGGGMGGGTPPAGRRPGG
jgi:hypothetical protein